MLVAVDYFIKWVEAKALANIRDVDMKKFVWENIMTQFGVPNLLHWIMAYSLITRFFASTVVISTLRIGSPPWFIPRVTVRLKPRLR